MKRKRLFGRSIKEKFYQFVSILLSAALIGTSGELAQAASVLSAPRPLIDLSSFSIPGHLGTISDAYRSGNDKRFVFIVQDLHIHPPVQKKIREILEFLLKTPQLKDTRLVGVEGAAGNLPTMAEASRPNPAIKRKVADYLIEQGELTGAEAYAIEQGHGDLLWGVENDKFYQADRSLYVMTLKARKELRQRLEFLDARLAEVTKHLKQPPAVQEASRLEQALNEGQVQPTAVLRTWLQQGADLPLKMRPYPRLRALAEVIQVQDQGSHPELDDATLRSYAQEHSGMRSFSRFEVVQELLAFAPEFKAFLTHDKRSENAFLAQKSIGFLIRYLSQQATADEVMAWTRHMQEMIARVKALGLLSDEEMDDLTHRISNQIDFYSLALVRNEPMVNNLLGEMKRRGSANTAVLIAGGFHTRGLTDVLRKQGVSYLVITPEIEEDMKPEYAALYEERLAENHLSAEEIERAVSKKLDLAIPNTIQIALGSPIRAARVKLGFDIGEQVETISPRMARSEGNTRRGSSTGYSVTKRLILGTGAVVAGSGVYALITGALSTMTGGLVVLAGVALLAAPAIRAYFQRIQERYRILGARSIDASVALHPWGFASNRMAQNRFKAARFGLPTDSQESIKLKVAKSSKFNLVIEMLAEQFQMEPQEMSHLLTDANVHPDPERGSGYALQPLLLLIAERFGSSISHVSFANDQITIHLHSGTGMIFDRDFPYSWTVRSGQMAHLGEADQDPAGSLRAIAHLVGPRARFGMLAQSMFLSGTFESVRDLTHPKVGMPSAGADLSVRVDMARLNSEIAKAKDAVRAAEIALQTPESDWSQSVGQLNPGQPNYRKIAQGVLDEARERLRRLQATRDSLRPPEPPIGAGSEGLSETPEEFFGIMTGLYSPSRLSFKTEADYYRKKQVGGLKDLAEAGLSQNEQAMWDHLVGIFHKVFQRSELHDQGTTFPTSFRLFDSPENSTITIMPFGDRTVFYINRRFLTNLVSLSDDLKDNRIIRRAALPQEMSHLTTVDIVDSIVYAVAFHEMGHHWGAKTRATLADGFETRYMTDTDEAALQAFRGGKTYGMFNTAAYKFYLQYAGIPTHVIDEAIRALPAPAERAIHEALRSISQILGVAPAFSLEQHSGAVSRLTVSKGAAVMARSEGGFGRFVRRMLGSRQQTRRESDAGHTITVHVPTLEGSVAVELPGNEPVALDELIPLAVRSMTETQRASMGRYVAQIPGGTLAFYVNGKQVPNGNIAEPGDVVEIKAGVTTAPAGFEISMMATDHPLVQALSTVIGESESNVAKALVQNDAAASVRGVPLQKVLQTVTSKWGDYVKSTAMHSDARGPDLIRVTFYSDTELSFHRDEPGVWSMKGPIMAEAARSQPKAGHKLRLAANQLLASDMLRLAGDEESVITPISDGRRGASSEQSMFGNQAAFEMAHTLKQEFETPRWGGGQGQGLTVSNADLEIMEKYLSGEMGLAQAVTHIYSMAESHSAMLLIAGKVSLDNNFYAVGRSALLAFLAGDHSEMEIASWAKNLTHDGNKPTLDQSKDILRQAKRQYHEVISPDAGPTMARSEGKPRTAQSAKSAPSVSLVGRIGLALKAWMLAVRNYVSSLRAVRLGRRTVSKNLSNTPDIEPIASSNELGEVSDPETARQARVQRAGLLAESASA